MGDVVRLKDFCRESELETVSTANSMVPIEFAVGLGDRHRCLAKLAEYGVGGIQVRQLNHSPDALVYMMNIQDALWLNKKILELEELSEEDIAERIDLIQMLENIDLPMMRSLWGSITGGPSQR
ncbi:MAG: hypothetical protein AB8B95_05010 [Pseudohongiellaceae bacterium]